MIKLEKLVVPTVIFIIVLAVFQTISPYLQQIDVSQYPNWLQLFANAFIRLVLTIPWATGLSYAWAFFGFLRFRLGDETIEFEAKKLYNTWLWYIGLIYTISVGAGIQNSAWISATIMAVKAVFNKVLEKP